MNIRTGREAAGMSQAELARAARVAQPNISAYENGRRQPSPEVLERIRRALLEIPGLARRSTRGTSLHDGFARSSLTQGAQASSADPDSAPSGKPIVL